MSSTFIFLSDGERRLGGESSRQRLIFQRDTITTPVPSFLDDDIIPELKNESPVAGTSTTARIRAENARRGRKGRGREQRRFLLFSRIH